jgi:hypothetical protein
MSKLIIDSQLLNTRFKTRLKTLYIQRVETKNEFNDFLLFFNTVCALHCLRETQFSTDETTTNQHVTIVTLHLHFLECCSVTHFDNCDRNCVRRSYSIIFYKISILADLLSSFLMTGTSYKHLSLVYI